MSRTRQDHPRPPNAAEKVELVYVSQTLTYEAPRVAQVKELLAVVDGRTYAEAARAAGVPRGISRGEPIQQGRTCGASPRPRWWASAKLR